MLEWLLKFLMGFWGATESGLYVKSPEKRRQGPGPPSLRVALAERLTIESREEPTFYQKDVSGALAPDPGPGKLPGMA
jgi:hypothetical protein